MKTAYAILLDYKDKVQRLNAIGSAHKELRALTTQDVLYLKAVMHPTSKKETKLLTKKLIEYLCFYEICTAQQIYDDLGFSERPVLERLKTLREHGMVRRESKKFYIATPRLLELKEKYLQHLCDER